MVKKETIEKFLASKKIALAGASRNPKKFGNKVFDALKQKNYEVLPVNPNADFIGGVKTYPDVNSLPDDCKSLIILTKQEQTDKLVSDAVSKGIQNIWIQQMSETKTALEAARNNNINLIYKECIFMHLQPVNGVHAFHRFMRKVFGKLPG